MCSVNTITVICRTLSNALSIINESESETDGEIFNEAMVEESDESDHSETDCAPVISQCM